MVELEGAAYSMERFLREEEARMRDLEKMEFHAGDLLHEVREHAP